jgi:hypothetical protein
MAEGSDEHAEFSVEVPDTADQFLQHCAEPQQEHAGADNVMQDNPKAEVGADSFPAGLVQKAGAFMVELMERREVIQFRYENRYPKVFSLLAKIDKFIPGRDSGRAGPAYAIYEQRVSPYSFNSVLLMGSKAKHLWSSEDSDLVVVND